MLDKRDNIYKVPEERENVTHWGTEDQGARSQADWRITRGKAGRVDGAECTQPHHTAVKEFDLYPREGHDPMCILESWLWLQNER